MERLSAFKKPQQKPAKISDSFDEIARCYIDLLTSLQQFKSINFVVAKEIACELIFKCIYAGLLIGKTEPGRRSQLLKKVEEIGKSSGHYFRDLDIFLSKTVPKNLNTKLTELNLTNRTEAGTFLLKQKLNLTNLIQILDGKTHLHQIDSINFGFLYERLAFSLTEADLGKSGSDNSTAIRKIFGTFFTPIHIAEFITKNALDSQFSNRRSAEIKIFDPAVGSGIFLIQSFRYLTQKLRTDAMKQGTPTSSRFIYRRACKSLFGNDIDPMSVEITKMALSIESEFAKVDDILGRQLFCHDGLLEASKWSRMEFDVILMNPPYGRVKDSDKRKTYSSQYADYISGEINLYKLFIALTFRILKSGGNVGIICPSDFLRESSSETLRKKMMSEFDHQYMLDLPLNFFPGVSLEPFIGIMKRKEVQELLFSDSGTKWFSEKNRKNISFGEIVDAAEERKISDLMNPSDFSIGAGVRKKISKKNFELVALEEVFEVNFGFHPGSNKSFSDEKRNSNYRLAIEGRDVDCFQTSSEKKYIYLSDGDYGKYRKTKVVMQRVRTRKIGPDSKWMRAVLDTKGCVNMASTNGLYLKNDYYDPFALIAILNSDWIEEELKAICTNVNLTAATLYKLYLPIPKNAKVMQKLSRIGKKLSLEGIGTKGDSEVKKKIEKLLEEVNEVIK